jgi:hypothetical protein
MGVEKGSAAPANRNEKIWVSKPPEIGVGGST